MTDAGDADDDGLVDLEGFEFRRELLEGPGRPFPVVHDGRPVRPLQASLVEAPGPESRPTTGGV